MHPKTWDELLDWLHSICPELPTKPHEFQSSNVEPTSNVDELCELVRSAVASHAEEVLQAIERLSLGAEVETLGLTTGAAECLRQRVLAATFWIELATLHEEFPAIEPPDMPFPRLARWMLIDLWDKWGFRWWCERLALNNWELEAE